jgi:hypothetical protein
MSEIAAKTGGTALAASAPSDTTNANNIASGTLVTARGDTNCSVASGTYLDNITGFSSTGVINRTGAGAYSSWLRRGSGNVVLATSPIARPDRNGGGRQPHTTFDPWRSSRLIQGSATRHPRPANNSTNRRRGGEEEFIQQESVRAIYTPRGREPALRRNADSQR